MEIKFEHIITAVVAVGAYILYQKKIAGTASQSAAGKTITPANTLLNKIVTGDLPGSSRGSKPIALDFSPYLDSKTGQWIVGQEADSKPIYAGDMISPPAHTLGPESFKDLPNDWLVQLNFNQPDNIVRASSLTMEMPVKTPMTIYQGGVQNGVQVAE